MVCTSSKAFESIFFWYTQTFPALHRFCLSYNKCDTFFPVSTKPFASHVVVMAIWGSERNQSFSRDSLISSQWWSVMGTPMCRGEVKWVWRTVGAIPYTSWFVCQCVMWRHLKETLGKIGVHFLNVGVHFVGTCHCDSDNCDVCQWSKDNRAAGLFPQLSCTEIT